MLCPIAPKLGFFFNFVIFANLAKIRKTSPTFYTLKMIISQVMNIRSPVSVHLAKSARLHPNPTNMSYLSLAAHRKNSQIAGSLGNFVQH
jgi:hypothetical protein